MVEFVCTLDENQTNTWGYQGDIETVFTNLTTNAYKALKPLMPERYFKIEVLKEADNLVIYAENNGKVIEIENRGKIFEPLFSTYSDGTGLGLTIVQDTLVNYGGRIELCSNYPETKFKITIPQKEQPEEV